MLRTHSESVGNAFMRSVWHQFSVPIRLYAHHVRPVSAGTHECVPYRDRGGVAANSNCQQSTPPPSAPPLSRGGIEVRRSLERLLWIGELAAKPTEGLTAGSVDGACTSTPQSRLTPCQLPCPGELLGCGAVSKGSPGQGSCRPRRLRGGCWHLRSCLHTDGQWPPLQLRRKIIP